MHSVRLWKGLALVVFVALATVSVGAQVLSEPMSPERSRAVQAQLEKIDGDRAGFVNQLFSAWTPYLDSNKYDLWSELGPTAMKVPAWQLYGASLVGDFKTMTRVLKGLEGAGHYINALAEPQAKTAPDLFAPEPYAFGDTQDQLVFVPIAPCRVVDTRNAGARTGILTAGEARSFDLEDDAFLNGQGVTGPCAGLPISSEAAWAVNVTVTGYSGTGWLTIWPFSSAETFTSVINYGTGGASAVANGLTLRGCYLCVGGDIHVKASAAGTHVIIDVTGYYRGAGVANAAVTRILGETQTVAANNSLFIDGGVCPAGTVLIGGEVDHSENDVAVAKTLQLSATQWRFWMKNNTAAGVSVTAYSRCMDTPLRLP
jgi:hypothetical protein